MTEEEKREQVIYGLADLMKVYPFTLEYKVKKKPSGIKVVIELTQEEMNILEKQFLKKGGSASSAI